MRKLFSIYGVVCLCVSGMIFSGCVKEDIKKISLSDHNPLWAAEIAHSEFSLSKITGAVKDSLLSKGTSPLTFVSSGHFSSLSGNAVFPLPDQSKTTIIALSAAGVNSLIATGTITLSITDTALCSFPNSALVKSIHFKSGSLKITFIHQFKHDAQITLSIPQLKLNGVPYNQVVALNYTGANPVLSQTIVDLSGYVLNLAFGSTLPQNKFAFTMTDMMTYIPNNPIVIANTTAVDFKFSSLQFLDMDGNLGSFPFPVNSSSFNIDFFKNAVSGGASLTSPRLQIEVTNSMGFPVDGSFLQHYGLSGFTGVTALTAGTLFDKLTFAYPTSKGSSKVKTLVLDKTNSNIVSLVAQSPSSLFFQTSDTARPVTTTYTYFLTDTGHYDTDIELQLPMSGTYSSLTFQDSVRVNFSSFSKNKIDSLRIHIENKFPLSATVQGFFMDANNLITDSLFKQNKFTAAGAAVGNNGLSSSSMNSSAMVPVDDLGFQKLLAARKLILRISLNVPSALPSGVTALKLVESYKLSLKIGAQFRNNLSFRN